MNADRIIQWCVYCDYPIFRLRLWGKRYWERMNKYIFYPSRHHGYVDLEEWTKEKGFFEKTPDEWDEPKIPLTWASPISIDYGKEDWRQSETEPCLLYSNSDWVWFSEQDFFVKNWDKFYEDIEKAMKTSDAIGWWNPTNFPYIHPCCLFIKRELLEKTKKDFRAHPEINGADHFSMITHDAQELGAKITTLQELGYKNKEDCFHLGGLTYPYQNFKEWQGAYTGVGDPEIFYVYNYFCRQVDVPQHPIFNYMSQTIEKRIKHDHPEYGNPEDSPWKPFFI